MFKTKFQDLSPFLRAQVNDAVLLINELRNGSPTQECRRFLSLDIQYLAIVMVVKKGAKLCSLTTAHN